MANTASSALPAGYSLAAATPSIEDYLRLRAVAGLSAFSRASTRQGLAGGLHSVTIRFGENVVGMGRIIGDGGCFAQIVDIAVHPDHQGQGVGKAIMTALMRHVETSLPPDTYVSLIADIPAHRLYAQFGFVETAPSALGMTLWRP